MKSGRFLALGALVLGALVLGACLSPPARAVTVDYYLWTGIGNGWKGGVTPPWDGTAALVFGHSVRNRVPLPGDVTVNSLHFLGEEEFEFFSGLPATLSINNGIGAEEASFAHVDFGANLSVQIVNNQAWHLGDNGSAILHGPLAGSGSMFFTGTGFPALILANLTGTPSTFSGNLFLDPWYAGSTPGMAPRLSVWGANSIGTGQITFGNGGTLTTHLGPTLPNNFVFNDGALLPGQTAHHSIAVRVWDAPGTTLAGNITLANDTVLVPLAAWSNKLDLQLPHHTGALPLPGPQSRHPLILAGAIGDDGNARSLKIAATPGLVIVTGTASTYSGGTVVDGTLVFGSNASVPSSGMIQVGKPLFSSGGYVGLGDVSPGAFATFLGKISPTSVGAVGVDTLPGQPIAVLQDAVNLALEGFDPYMNFGNGIRLGTATRAILRGSITPTSSNYYFGNGGGTLYVQSPLTDLYGMASELVMHSWNIAPLTLFVQAGPSNEGGPYYTGRTFVSASLLVFDTGFLPTGELWADGISQSVGSSYIGRTQQVDISTQGFLAKFRKANTWGIIGFDTQEGSEQTATYSDEIDLTGFHDGVFLGTATSAILSGNIIPSTIGNAYNAANSIRLTAARGGQLYVNSLIGDLNDGTTPVGTIIGPPSQSEVMGNGTVTLAASNTYTGGTTINNFGNITAVAGTSTAFGSGAITLAAQGGIVGLAAGAPGLELGNDFVFAPPGSRGTAKLSLVGANNFTLSGNISGPVATGMESAGTIQLALPIEVTLTGDNSGFSGYFEAINGRFHFDHNAATGLGAIRFIGAAGTATFNAGGTAANPVLYGLEGAGGTVVLPNGTNLTINLDHPHADYDFGGYIGGDDHTVTTASLTVTGSGGEGGTDFLYLYGSNQYSGGTLITGQSALGLGHASAAGSGPITIDTTDGGLALNAEVVLGNAITLTRGGLAGLGTFSPSAFNGAAGGPIVIGANNVVLAGIPGDHFVAGSLTFGLDTVFQAGGAYQWVLSNPEDPDAYSLLNISGTLDLSPLGAGQFLIAAETVDADGNEGESSGALVYGQNYSLKIISTTGGLIGFEASDFVLDVSNFQQGAIPANLFSLSADANSIYLNFVAVPEPSTWALMIVGAGFLGLAAWRRRRA
ncbi:MAG TPA: PEP-CTERM sorting domain-containing protein [Opitutaceae bacterium]|nr:PEP-CTERM sorting domain-containing protein [Opitutaceae bacterium]